MLNLCKKIVLDNQTSPEYESKVNILYGTTSSNTSEEKQERINPLYGDHTHQDIDADNVYQSAE